MSAPEKRMIDFTSRLETWTTALNGALDRIEALRTKAKAALGCEAGEAMLFNLERAGWAAIELAQAWVFEAKLEAPKRPQDVFEIMSRAGWLGQDEARRLKQVSEHRNLASRDPARVEWSPLVESLTQDIAVLRAWSPRARAGDNAWRAALATTWAQE